MNVLLWIVQALVALLFVAGGVYKLQKPDELAKQQIGLTPIMWRLLGVVEALGGILVVIPASVTRMPSLMAIAATVLVAETLVLVALYGRRSVKMVAANPFVWAALQALLAGFVAWGRYPA